MFVVTSLLLQLAYPRHRQSSSWLLKFSVSCGINSTVRVDNTYFENVSGFKWKLTKTFEQRFHDLDAFKSEFWHVMFPKSTRWIPHWGFSAVRSDSPTINYSKDRHQTENLTQDQIKRLEEIDFKWKLKWLCQDIFATLWWSWRASGKNGLL